ncbi:hypothetical protein VC83_06444 [Pseudogymnoascus destructans]|uniref:Uncharacterized protein n=1 Tax=Pseudogymnoascus destructans TaxID=655981 RepID=A0A177A7X7_9PEZI|nr:uncharacterized protein VC83_06444 [Pseudogymnoascus destructans]OAF58265.1 hypothetical protein VC83_06444 [Pseudogymnoascus destructans]
MPSRKGDLPPPEDIPMEEAPAEEHVEQVLEEQLGGGVRVRPRSMPLRSLLPLKTPLHLRRRNTRARKERLAFASQATELEPEPAPEPEPEPVPPPVDLPSLTFPLLRPRVNHRDGCDPGEHFYVNRNYSNVFLCHASLSALADIQEIETLKALSHKLHKTLCVFEIDNVNARDVMTL